MRVIIWGIAGSASLGLGLVTGREEIGAAGWSVLTLLIVGACCQITQPRLAMLLFGIAGLVSIGAISDDDLAIGMATSVISLALVALTALGWRQRWRQMRRDIVHQAIDQQLVPVDLPRSREPSRSRDVVATAARPMTGNHPADAPNPIEIHRRRA